MDIQSIKWPETWEPTTDTRLEKELSREVASGHLLYKVKATPIGRCGSNDDVLFKLENGQSSLAVVHLTWSSKQETPPWPMTEFYDSFENWNGKMKRA